MVGRAAGELLPVRFNDSSRQLVMNAEFREIKRQGDEHRLVLSGKGTAKRRFVHPDAEIHPTVVFPGHPSQEHVNSLG